MPSNMNTNVPIPSKWIYSRKEDFMWVSLPALVGFLLIGLFYLLTKYFHFDEYTAIAIVYVPWLLLFDGTHSFATYTRTYFDREYYVENKGMLLRSLLLFLVGPAIVTLFFVFTNDIDYASMAFICFNRFAICYAYYHLIRQHWGFLVIYRKKAQMKDDISRTLDGLLLAFGTLYPFIHSQVLHFQTLHVAEKLNLNAGQWGVFSTYAVIASLMLIGTSYIPMSILKNLGLRTIGVIGLIVSGVVKLFIYFGMFEVASFLSTLFLAAFIAILAYYAFLIVTKKVEMGPSPKWFFLFVVVVSYNIIFHLEIPIFIIIAAITVFHNIQYHKIVNFYNKKKYKKEKKSQYGFAVTLTQKMGAFVVLALFSNFFYAIPRVASYELPNQLINYLLLVFFWGIAFHHYYLDSVIWKSKNNSQMSQPANAK